MWNINFSVMSFLSAICSHWRGGGQKWRSRTPPRTSNRSNTSASMKVPSIRSFGQSASNSIAVMIVMTARISNWYKPTKLFAKMELVGKTTSRIARSCRFWSSIVSSWRSGSISSRALPASIDPVAPSPVPRTTAWALSPAVACACVVSVRVGVVRITALKSPARRKGVVRWPSVASDRFAWPWRRRHLIS